jgi:hypothetical protein
MIIKKRLALMSIIIFATSFNVMAEKVRQAATDGMVLNLGNYTQQVKVRAKALGSNNCNVEFSVKEIKVTVVAPVTNYSQWVDIGPTYLGPANEKLGVSVKCDAGAIAQVEYHQ